MVEDENAKKTNLFYNDGGYMTAYDLDDRFLGSLPWLYYRENKSPKPGTEVLMKSGRVKFRASFALH